MITILRGQHGYSLVALDFYRREDQVCFFLQSLCRGTEAWVCRPRVAANDVWLQVKQLVSRDQVTKIHFK